MSTITGPQNNLDSVRKNVQSQHTTNIVSNSVLPKASSSKFKPALGTLNHARSNPISRKPSDPHSSPSLPSFATPGFGKKTVKNSPAPAPASAPPRRSIIDLSRDPTIEFVDEPIPSRKRPSLDGPEGAQPPAPKRPRDAVHFNKENVFTTGSSSKGKRRAFSPRQWTPDVLTDANTSNHIDASSRPNPFVKPPFPCSDPSAQLSTNSDLDSRSRGFLEQILGRNRQLRQHLLKLISEHERNTLDIMEVSFLLAHLERRIEVIEGRLACIGHVNEPAPAPVALSEPAPTTLVDTTDPEDTIDISVETLDVPDSDDLWDSLEEPSTLQMVATLTSSSSRADSTDPSSAESTGRARSPSFQMTAISTSHAEPPTFQVATTSTQTSSRAHSTDLPVCIQASTGRVDNTSTPYYREAIHVLKNTFRLSTFRQNQLEAINATLDGKDVFVLMPTGGGKSLCYQLPAVCRSGRTHGVTFVVSPLVALIADQVASLREKNINGDCMSSLRSVDDSRDVMRRLRSAQKPDICYITPEKLRESNAMQEILAALYEDKQIARFVIDEAHVIQSWGRDFRDAYAELHMLRDRYPDVPIMALTATANKTAIQDIHARLGLRDPVCLVQSFNRPNLYYAVQPKPTTKKKVVQAIAGFIKSQHAVDTGIVYGFSKVECEELAEQLRKDYGLSAKHYHAGMEAQERSTTQEEWQSGRCKIIVATIAFGMGIDKPDVRFVIHSTLPKSMDGYYQETGRAGRDGEPADCVLYYAYKDVVSRLHMINNDRNDKGMSRTAEEKRRQIEDIRAVSQYCRNEVDCRRSMILAHFNEHFDPHLCPTGCDNCSKGGTIVRQLFTSEAQQAIRLFEQMAASMDRIPVGHFKDVFAGRNKAKVRDSGHDQLSLFGVGKGVDGDRIISVMMDTDIFAIAREASASGWTNDYLKLGSQAESCLNGSLAVELTFRDSGPSSGLSRSVVKNVALPKVPAGTKGKVKADPGPSSYMPLYDDDDDDLDPVSDFEPIKDAADTGPASQPEDASYLRLKALLAARQRLAQEHDLRESEVLATETLHFLALMNVDDRASFDTCIINSDEPNSRDKVAVFGAAFWKAYSDTEPTSARSSSKTQARVFDLRGAFSFNQAT